MDVGVGGPREEGVVERLRLPDVETEPARVRVAVVVDGDIEERSSSR